jgi:hypothetical protein
MPFLEYHRLIKSNYKKVRTSRGYDALDTWQWLERVFQAGRRLTVRDARLAKPVLSAGRCPGLWRVYYAATRDAQTDSIYNAAEYLGNRVPVGTTRRKLGKLFEQWVTTANQAYNHYLETAQIGILASIPGIIGEHYRERAEQHSRESSTDDLRLSKMRLGPLQARSELPIYDLDPDGIFSECPPGAVFESKLSVPSYFEFDTEMAIYALAFEKLHHREIDFAITLYSDFPRGLQILPIVRRIFDSHIDEITTNLQKFYRLIQYSEATYGQGRISKVGPLIRSLTHIGYRSWKSFLVRPDGLPESQEYCETCKYRNDCFNDGEET